MSALTSLLLVWAYAGATPGGQGRGIDVYEDAFGVPSIVAGSLADAGYALGYVEAKDHAERMAENYKTARGRLGEIRGRTALLQDGFIRGVGFERRALALADGLTGEPKTLIDGFVAGANKALAEQKGQLPTWVEPFTAVDVLSLAQFVNAAFPLLNLASQLTTGTGSNQFALAGSRTSTHHPILSMDPHLGWDGQDGGIVWQEFALYTPDIHFRGVAIPGLPMGVMGHNERVAWSMTNNNPALYTIYSVKTNPADHNQYSYHGVWKDFATSKMELRYLENGVLKSSTSTVRSTEWGPMVPMSNRSVRLAVPEATATVQQGLAMMRAKSVADFGEALNLRGLSMWNFVFADVDGNIRYQYNALTPQRASDVDWRKTVAGDDPKTAWGENWPLDRLPHAENPASGILVNCNSDPKLTPLGDEVKGTWPADVTSYGPTTRWEMLSELLKSSRRVNPDRAKEIATDCTVPYAAQTVAQLARFVQIGNAIEILKKWDHKATVDSVGCALYTYWLRERRENSGLSVSAGKGAAWSEADGALAAAALASASTRMIADQGTLDARWGGVQYMQRGAVKMPVQGFGYVAPGSGIAAVCPSSAEGDTLKAGRSHATFGSSFRMIVSLDPKGVQSWSVLPYGNSEVSTSPHYTDQMELYSVGKYKNTSFGLAGVKKNSIKSYHIFN